jgi:hypothetical protein
VSKTLEAGWARAALACVALACAMPIAARLIAGPPGAEIQVEFQPTVDSTTQQQIAARYRLGNPRKLQDTYTWRYELIDTSSANIEALVRDPNVNDTHEINRNTFTLEPTAPAAPRRLRFDAGADGLVDSADVLAIVLLLMAALLGATRATPRELLLRGVPEITAETAGAFRILFGGLVLLFFATHPVDASWLSATFDVEVEGRVHQALLAWFGRHPVVVNAITPAVLTMAALFTLGIFTRVSYALFVVAAIAWAYVAMSLDSTHPLAAFMLGLFALLPSRWGDALSVDAYLRRKRGGPDAAAPPGKEYGYAVWVPGLVFGVGYAAAAWAKLAGPPGWTDWILNGTVKYHFITDSGLAPFGWGLQLAHYPTLAILMSFYAIATEALVVTAAFVKNEVYRLMMGLAGWALVGGFYVFMGHFWPGWWILIVGFLPWQKLDALIVARLRDPRTAVTSPAPTRTAFARATAMQFAVVGFVLVQQVVTSTIEVERAPMFSFYPMYSGTYTSPANFESRRPPRYRIVMATDRGTTTLRCNPHEEFVREFQAAVDGSRAAREGVWRALRGCTVSDDFNSMRYVTLEGEIRSFDWDRLVFTDRPAPPIGPLQADQHGTQ